MLPGLIDVHVHLGADGGFYEDPSKAFDPKTTEHKMEAYFYSGVTAVRSAGDKLEDMIKLRRLFGSGEKLGTELFFCGPLFTAEDGHGTEYAKFMPEALRASFLAGFVRIPHSPEEARQQVDELALKGVDAIKGVLEAGVARLFLSNGWMSTSWPRWRMKRTPKIFQFPSILVTRSMSLTQ